MATNPYEVVVNPDIAIDAAITDSSIKNTVKTADGSASTNEANSKIINDSIKLNAFAKTATADAAHAKIYLYVFLFLVLPLIAIAFGAIIYKLLTRKSPEATWQQSMG